MPAGELFRAKMESHVFEGEPVKPKFPHTKKGLTISRKSLNSLWRPQGDKFLDGNSVELLLFGNFTKEKYPKIYPHSKNILVDGGGRQSPNQ